MIRGFIDWWDDAGWGERAFYLAVVLLIVGFFWALNEAYNEGFDYA